MVVVPSAAGRDAAAAAPAGTPGAMGTTRATTATHSAARTGTTRRLDTESPRTRWTVPPTGNPVTLGTGQRDASRAPRTTPVAVPDRSTRSRRLGADDQGRRVVSRRVVSRRLTTRRPWSSAPSRRDRVDRSGTATGVVRGARLASR